MDQESIVYGCIKDLADFATQSERRRNNRRVMLTLPSEDDWPFCSPGMVSQEMFSIPRVEVGLDNYHTEVIHFGASYKAIEYEWSRWMAQFEKLLSELYWVSAIVHLDTELAGTHTFTWESTCSGHKPGMCIGQVRREWSHESAFA